MKKKMEKIEKIYEFDVKKTYAQKFLACKVAKVSQTELANREKGSFVQVVRRTFCLQKKKLCFNVEEFFFT